MDQRRFDAITRSIGERRSRRAVLAGVLGLAGLPFAGTARAARRTTPTPPPVSCPGSQFWNGSACACSEGTACGPACCTEGGVCCDGACCYGTCYGEELCCPTGMIEIGGACFAACAGATLSCPPTCEACVILEESSPIEICANVVQQLCSTNADCVNNGGGWVCSPLGDQCLHVC